jgi:hypothetical protein
MRLADEAEVLHRNARHLIAVAGFAQKPPFAQKLARLHKNSIGTGSSGGSLEAELGQFLHEARHALELHDHLMDV